MAATGSKGGLKPPFNSDSDVHITYEDQQKINRFARLNAKLEDYKDEIKSRENDLQSIEEASEEIELFDDDEQIPYLVGEVFIYQNVENTQSSLAEAKKNLENEIKELKDKASGVKDMMAELKICLYGKFGNHIHLETDDEE
ncbi:unnamed protein product [Acanthoscelides obtectus]|uniref:Prefoldin subunit 4 n=1 Tax=Acanthoscelides obtectus TaxID=200917 RepID=A0A9P0NZN1_ACAOB|nr:unnamed protein product [Acanthoscelides obtectus]CAK1639132.1 Probable prefoldin subunit 4 [Acanthoscelides obtectus]